jgi:aminoglycoside phosphotransferase (APT) family kinase protein
VPIPQQRDPEVTRRQLTPWLASKMPGARDLTITNLAPPALTGFSSDTLLFDLAWTEDGRMHQEGFVIRIEPTACTVFPEYDIAQQFRVMQTLRAASDVPLPRIYWLEESPTVLGAPFFVMGKVAGRVPPDNPPYHAAGWMTEISPAERAALWWDGLDVLARIHRLDWQRLGLHSLDRTGAPGLDAQLDYYTRYLTWAARGRPQPVAEAAYAWLQRHKPVGEPLGLCWGDARIGNMIFADGRCRAVLDWEMATLGNPIQDLAWWLFLDRHHSEGIGLPRLDGLPGRDETVARYEELTGRPVAHLEYYEVFAAFRFAVIMCRLAQMLITFEALPPDSDMETNNIVTQLLAKMLDLPAPASPSA